MAQGLQLMGADAPSPAEATYFQLQKVEMGTTFIYVQVMDGARAATADLLAKNAERMQQAETLLDRVQNVAILYLLAEADSTPRAAIPDDMQAGYFGQPVYSVFWRINLDTGAITVPSDQPKELFGLRELALAARENALEEANAPPVFDAVEEAEALVSGKPLTDTSVSKRAQTTPFKGFQNTRRSRFRALVMQASYDVRVKYSMPVLAITVLVANLMVLLFMYTYGDPHSASVGVRFGAIWLPPMLWGGEWWRMFTAIFVHFGPMHLIANTMGLLIFGTRIEKYFGRIAFLSIYLLSGLMGSLFSVANAYFRNAYGMVSAGASGAVYGLIGAMFVYTRFTRRDIETLNWRVMLIFIGIGLIMGFSMPGIDNAAHIGGLVGGGLVGFVMLALMAWKVKRARKK